MSDLVDTVDGTVHKPTQGRGDGGVDLTMAEIHELRAPGRVDFGGGELDPAETEPHSRV
jgi:hypothetical protein